MSTVKPLPAGKSLHMACDMHTMDWIFFYNPDGLESIQMFWNGQNIWDRQSKVIITLDGEEYWETVVENIQDLDNCLKESVEIWKTFRWIFVGKH